MSLLRSIVTMSFVFGVSVAIADTPARLDNQLAELAQNAAIRRNSSPVQTFFVAECEHNDDLKCAYWPEARLLIWIADGTEDDSPAILLSEFFDLEDDVVNEQAEIGTSNYLVTEDWASQQIATANEGRMVRIRIVVADRAKLIGLPN